MDGEEKRVVIRRADQAGDLGWIVMAHGETYAHQFGWNSEFEALVARIVADYGSGHDSHRESAWIAEVGGERVGSIMLVSSEEPQVARLRILLVTPAGRGLGIGTGLVHECITFARRAGYHAITLWTNDVLRSARKIYESAGFVLTEERRHHSFGHDLVGQNWTLALD